MEKKLENVLFRCRASGTHFKGESVNSFFTYEVLARVSERKIKKFSFH